MTLNELESGNVIELNDGTKALFINNEKMIDYPSGNYLTIKLTDDLKVENCPFLYVQSVYDSLQDMTKIYGYYEKLDLSKLSDLEKTILKNCLVSGKHPNMIYRINDDIHVLQTNGFYIGNLSPFNHLFKMVKEKEEYDISDLFKNEESED